MEIIYSDIKIEDRMIQNCLESLFPKLVCFHWDMVSDPPSNLDFENPLHVYYHTLSDGVKLEFGHCLTIERTPKMDYQEREIHIIRWLSKKIETRFLTTYTDPKEPMYPYYSLIFEDNQIFLADDSNTNFADGETGLVKKIGLNEFSEFRFSAMADLIY